METKTISLPLPADIVERADADAVRLAVAEINRRLGVPRKVSRSAVLRLAIIRGLEVLEAEALA